MGQLRNLADDSGIQWNWSAIMAEVTAMFQVSLSTVKDIATIAQSIAVFSVALGGAWLYLRRRQRFPRARMTHDIRHKRISDSAIAIFVIVTVRNLGEVIVRLQKGFTWIR